MCACVFITGAFMYNKDVLYSELYPQLTYSLFLWMILTWLWTPMGLEDIILLSSIPDFWN